jgi:hypothetical protein
LQIAARVFRHRHPAVVFLTLFASGLLAPGCDDDDNRDVVVDAAPLDAIPDEDAAIDAGIDAAIDAGPVLDCESPIVLSTDSQAESRARAALATLSATATLAWVAGRNTFQTIEGLAIERPGCTGRVDLLAELYTVLEATPDLFQFDPAEWTPDQSFTCDDVTEGDFETIRLRRRAYGPLVLRNDIFTVVARRTGGVLRLQNFYAVYIPPGDPGVLARLAGCPDLPTSERDAILRAAPLHYLDFLPPPAPICAPGDERVYLADDEDELEYAGQDEVFWDDVSSLRLRRVEVAILRVAEDNVTDALAGSTANCPADDGSPRVGWQLYFDAVTGERLHEVPTPVPGCIVC